MLRERRSIIQFVVNIVVGIVFWYLLISIFEAISLFSGFKYMNLFPDVDSYGSSLIGKHLMNSLPLLLGPLSGMWYYMKHRPLQSTVTPESISSPESKTNRNYFIYLLIAIVLILLIGGLMVRNTHDMSALIIPFAITGLAFGLILIPTFLFILRKALAVNSVQTSSRVDSNEKRMIYICGVIVCILFAFYIIPTIRTSSKVAMSVKIPDLIANPTKYDNKLIIDSVEIAYGVKGYSGFAVRYYNYYELGANPSAGNTYLWVEPGAINLYGSEDATCTHRTYIQVSDYTQWKLEESMSAFAKTYGVPPQDIIPYTCIHSYTVLGVFHHQSAGPNNLITMTVSAPRDGYDYNQFLEDAGTAKYTSHQYPHPLISL